MTIEEKAKAYDEALERLKPLYEQAKKDDNPIWSTYEYLIPELAESEDERIRKWIIEEFKIHYDFESPSLNPMVEKAMDWLEKQKVNTEGDFAKGYDCGYQCCLNSHGAEWFEKQKEQKPAECGCTNDESEYDKGYREGHRFGLKQTQEYMLPGGKTFSGLIPCWVNAPSELQPAHKYHGKNVVIMHENNGGFRCICIDDEKPITFHLPEDTLFVEGWRKKPAEWSEEDEHMRNALWNLIQLHYAQDNVPTLVGILSGDFKSWLKSLRPSWKPSEEQMDSLRDTIVQTKGYSYSMYLPELYEQLLKL